jgi:hypothetical protein
MIIGKRITTVSGNNTYYLPPASLFTGIKPLILKLGRHFSISLQKIQALGKISDKGPIFELGKSRS